MKKDENENKKEQQEESFFGSLYNTMAGLFSVSSSSNTSSLKQKISDPKDVRHISGIKSKTEEIFSINEKNTKMIEEYKKQIERKEVNKEYDQETFLNFLEKLEPLQGVIVDFLEFPREKKGYSQIEEKDQNTIKKVAEFLIRQEGAFSFYTDSVMRIRSIQKNLPQEFLQNENKDFKSYKEQVQKNIPINSTFLWLESKELRCKGLNKQLALHGVCIPDIIYKQWFFPDKKITEALKELKKMKKKLAAIEQDQNEGWKKSVLRDFLDYRGIAKNIKELLAGTEINRTAIAMKFSNIIVSLKSGDKFSLINSLEGKDMNKIQYDFMIAMAKPLDKDNQQEKIDVFNERLGLHGLSIPESILSEYVEQLLQEQKTFKM